MEKHFPEFKRHFYLNWFVQDWLGDQNLKLCPPEAKGLWMDMLMQMVIGFPYGHLSRLSKPLMRQSKIPLVKKMVDFQKPKSLKSNEFQELLYQTPDQVAYNLVSQDDDQWVQLSLELNQIQQLSLATNLEEKLPELTGYSPDFIEKTLPILDDLNIFSRTQSGIIYSRRLVRDFQKRKIAFTNATGGGKKAKNRKSNSLKTNSPSDLLYQNGKQNGKQTPDQTPDQTPQDLVGQSGGSLPHQNTSNSNSNRNSINSSVFSNSSSVGNSSGLGNTEKEVSQEKNGVEHSGSGKTKLNFQDLKVMKEKILKDNYFLEPFYQATNIKQAELNGWLDLFNLHCVVERKLEKDYKEYTSHFRHWVFKQDLTKKPPSLQEVKTVANNTVKSKTLLDKYSTLS